MRIAFLALLVVALAATQPISLKLGGTIQGDLTGAQTLSYSVTLTGGQYLHAEVRALSVDLMVRLYGPGGDRFLEVSTLDFPAKTAPVYYVADLPGDYRLTVTAQGRSAGKIHYEVK